MNKTIDCIVRPLFNPHEPLSKFDSIEIAHYLLKKHCVSVGGFFDNRYDYVQEPEDVPLDKVFRLSYKKLQKDWLDSTYELKPFPEPDIRASLDSIYVKDFNYWIINDASSKRPLNHNTSIEPVKNRKANLLYLFNQVYKARKSWVIPFVVEYDDETLLQPYTFEPNDENGTDIK